jgi:hypothetical protein
MQPPKKEYALFGNGSVKRSRGNDIRIIARQPIKTIEELLQAVFSVGSTPRLYSEDPRPIE